MTDGTEDDQHMSYELESGDPHAILWGYGPTIGDVVAAVAARSAVRSPVWGAV